MKLVELPGAVHKNTSYLREEVGCHNNRGLMTLILALSLSPL